MKTRKVSDSQKRRRPIQIGKARVFPRGFFPLIVELVYIDLVRTWIRQ
jgi:hypothetical protein